MKMRVQYSPTLNSRTRLGLLIGVSAAFIIALFFIPRVPLGPDYHIFADQRMFLDVPNCLDVLSNIPFVLVGAWGVISLLRMSRSSSFLESRERIPYLVFFAGVALTGIGSGWYHLVPVHSRLIWDLLPMTFSFTSLLSAVVVERISVKVGLWMLVPLNALGAASVLYLHLTALGGHGNLGPYLFVEFFPVIPIAMMVVLFPPRYTRTGDLGIAFFCFVLAKFFELLDRQIYSLGSIISGHSLKHLTAALACYWILRMITLRYPISHAIGDKGGLQRMARNAPTC